MTLEERAALVGSKLKSNDESSAVNATIIGVEDVGDANESNDNFYVIALQYITAGSFSASESLSTYGEPSEFDIDRPLNQLDPLIPSRLARFQTMSQWTRQFSLRGYFVLSEKVRIAAHATDSANSIRDFTTTTSSWF